MIKKKINIEEHVEGKGKRKEIEKEGKLKKKIPV